MWTSFRTEVMSLHHIFVRKEIAYNCISDLTETGIIHFHEGYGLTVGSFDFIPELKLCAHLEAVLEDLLDICVENEIEPVPCEEIPSTPHQNDLIQLKMEIKDLSLKIKTINSALSPIRSDYFEMFRSRVVIEYVRSVLDEQDEEWALAIYDTYDPLRSHQKLSEFVGFEIAAGFIPTSKVAACEKTIWRIGRGTVFFRYTPFYLTSCFFDIKEMTRHTMLIMIFQGYDEVQSMVRTICMGYGGVFIFIPKTPKERTDQYLKIKNDIKYTARIIENSQIQLREELSKLRLILPCLTLKVKKMKAIFVTLNELQSVSKLFYVVKCWIPVERVARAKYLVQKHDANHASVFWKKITTKETPPSLTYVSKVTKSYQAIIDAYGIPSYQEINPTSFTIITFPFLFAVMFGDVGHGTVVVVLTCWVIAKEISLRSLVRKNEICRLLFNGRYMILLMGIFGIYVGFIYNNIFSRPINIFGSSWKINYNISTIMTNHHLTLDPSKDDFSGVSYPFGMDPVWCAGGSENLPVLNSFKMKVSIILGVLHMIFGICVGICNKLYFKDYSSLWLESIPSLVFLCSLFFYLVLLIFYKWLFYGGSKKGRYSSSCAPLILISFINMVMFKSPNKQKEGCSKVFYDGEQIIEKFLVILAILMVPIMMFGKPLYIYYKRKQENGRKQMELDQSNASLNEDNINGHAHEEPMLDIIVHQLIHTIESVLGTVSHTASYLRLWALGLAHEQLSEVVWRMVLVKPLTTRIEPYYVRGILLFVTFVAWAYISVLILILMEGLSAFLHTLRLHWIEYQSRFFQGGGYKFQPLSFDELYQENVHLISRNLL